MMFRSYLILALALLLVVCAALLSNRSGISATLPQAQPTRHRNITIDLDSTFSSQEEMIIIKSAHRWESITNNRIHFIFDKKDIPENFSPISNFLSSDYNKNITNDKKVFLWKATSDSLLLKNLEIFLNMKLAGFTPGKYMMIVPDRLVSEKELTQVILHELGHLIGLHHTTSIMSTDEYEGFCITKIDMVQFCDLYRCNEKEIPSESCEPNGHL